MRPILLSLLLILPVATNLLADDITPEDAAAHICEIVTLQGTVIEVYVSKADNVYLNFGAPYPNQTFSADVLFRTSGNLLAEGNQWLKDFQGKTISVTGKITKYKGKPEIVLLEREDLRVVEGKLLGILGAALPDYHRLKGRWEFSGSVAHLGAAGNPSRRRPFSPPCSAHSLSS